MVYRSFTSSEKVVVDDITNLILGDINDDERYDSKLKVVVAWDGDEDLGVSFEVGGWGWDGEGSVKAYFLLKWRKEK